MDGFTFVIFLAPIVAGSRLNLSREHVRGLMGLQMALRAGRQGEELVVVVGWGRGLGEDQGSNKGLVRSQGRVPTGRAEGLFDMKVKDRSRLQHPGSNADQWETLSALRLVPSSLSGAGMDPYITLVK